jgi:hypothetical protein
MHPFDCLPIYKYSYLAQDIEEKSTLERAVDSRILNDEI